MGSSLIDLPKERRHHSFVYRLGEGWRQDACPQVEKHSQLVDRAGKSGRALA
jgi:hypothetical protein